MHSFVSAPTENSLPLIEAGLQIARCVYVDLQAKCVRCHKKLLYKSGQQNSPCPIVMLKIIRISTHIQWEH